MLNKILCCSVIAFAAMMFFGLNDAMAQCPGGVCPVNMSPMQSFNQASYIQTSPRFSSLPAPRSIWTHEDPIDVHLYKRHGGAPQGMSNYEMERYHSSLHEAEQRGQTYVTTPVYAVQAAGNVCQPIPEISLEYSSPAVAMSVPAVTSYHTVSSASRVVYNSRPRIFQRVFSGGPIRGLFRRLFCR